MAKKYKCRVEYLESTGTQYIDTGIKGKNNIDFDYKCIFTNLDGTAQCVGGNWSGAGTSTVSLYLGLIRTNGNFAYHYDGTQSPVVVMNTTVQDTPYTVQGHMWVGEQYMVINGTKSSVGTISSTFTSTLNMYLFGINNNGISNPAYMKLYYCKIYDNGVLVRDFIPVLDNSGRPAMYDQVSGQLFYNQGSGDDFTYGRQIIPVEYLESSGEQYIDTGYIPNQDTKAELDFKVSQDLATGFPLFGSRVSASSRGYSFQRMSSDYWGGMYGNTLTISTTTVDTNRHTVLKDKNVTYLDGVQISSSSTTTFTCPGTLYLNAMNNNGTAALQNCGVMYYGMKIYDNGTLVRDFIPCIDENLVPFMFDNVHNTVYLNAGTGQFKVGPNVEKLWGGKKLRRKLELALANLKKKRKYYCEVEYLENTGTQYIDTGFSPDANTRVDYKVQVTELQTGSEPFIGTRVGTANNNRFLPIAWHTGDGQLRTSFGSKVVILNETASIGSVFIGSFLPSELTTTINGVQYSFSGASFTKSQSNNLYIFAASGYSPDLYNCKGRMYYMKVFDNGTLVRDLIPVLDWNMTPCMYDKVTEQLFYNAGSGNDFSYGRQIHYVDYLESTGTQYINTGFKANTTTTKYQTKIVPADITTTQALFGSRNTLNIANTNNCEVFIYQSQFRLDWVNGDGSRGLFVPISVDTPYEIEVTRGRGVVNGIVYTSTEHTSANQNYDFLIGNFTNGSSTPFSGGFIGKIYYGKLYSNGVLVRDLKPAIDENGVGFMFDRVSHTIYDNAGTGAFAYPPVELEYLESNGNQYIDTGIQPTDEYGYRIRNTYTAGGGEQCAIGCMDSGNRFVGVYTSGSSNAISGAWGDYVGFLPNYPWTTGTILDVKCNYKNSRQITIDDTEVKDISDVHISGTISNSIYIGARNYGSNITKMKGNIYGAEITNGQNVVADFIPAFKDGQIGMYDKVSGVLKTNAGTGTFTTGKIVEPEYE